jgi:hypothetical protein
MIIIENKKDIKGSTNGIMRVKKKYKEIPIVKPKLKEQ